MAVILSQVFSTYKLVLEFSEIKIQYFPSQGIFPATSSNYVSWFQLG